MQTAAAEVRVVRTTVLPAPADVVWRALTDPDELAAWLGDCEQLQLERGGRGRLTLPDGGRRELVVDAVEPGRRLAFRWRDEDGEEPASSVELTLDGARSGTRLTVSERVDAGAVGTAARAWGARFELLQRALVLLAR